MGTRIRVHEHADRRNTHALLSRYLNFSPTHDVCDSIIGHNAASLRACSPGPAPKTRRDKTMQTTTIPGTIPLHTHACLARLCPALLHSRPATSCDRTTQHAHTSAAQPIPLHMHDYLTSTLLDYTPISVISLRQRARR
jgi:hypothetical protein